MLQHHTAGPPRPLIGALLCAALCALFPHAALGLEFAVQDDPGRERIVFSFEGGLPDYSLGRTQRQALELRLPPGYWRDHPRPAPQQPGADILQSVETAGDAVRIRTATDAFGYIHYPSEDGEALILDLFPDPLGARWSPPDQARPAPQPAPKPTPPVQEPTAAAEPDVAEPEISEPDIAEPNVAEPDVAEPDTAEPDTAEPDATSSDLATSDDEEQRQSFFSPSYTFRGQVKRSGYDPVAMSEPGREQSLPEPDLTTEPELPEPEQPEQTPAPEPVAAPAAPEQPEQPERPEPEERPDWEERATAAAPDPDTFPAAAADMTLPAGDAVPDASPQPHELRARMAPPGQAVEIAGDGSTESLPEPKAVTPETETPPLEGNMTSLADGEPQTAPEMEPAPEMVLEDSPADGDLDLETDNATEIDLVEEELGEEQQPPEEEGPPTAEELYEAAKVAYVNRDYAIAKDLFQQLKYNPDLTPEMREDVLHSLADLLYTMNRDNLREHYGVISDAFMEAMNFNLDSQKTPAVLLKLGLLNLKVGNIREAEAFFNILKEKHPHDQNVPLTYYYWGDYFFKAGEYQEAADHFQYVVQEYPDSQFVREASVGLTQSLYRLGYDKQAYQIVDYIEKRWPRYYVEYPPLLKLAGDVGYKLGDYDKAKVNYWTLYNIDPEGEEVDLVLARLGDIYSRNERDQAAREVYQKAADQFPDKEGGLIAQMRLAENGIHDEPSIEEMFSVFDRPFTLRPAQVYSRIVTEHPDSPLAPLAQLKLAMWELFNNRYRDALAAVDAFVTKFPDSELNQRAREVGVEAFGDMVELFVEEENYRRIVELWDTFPFLAEGEDKLESATRVALGLSYWKTGNPDEALAMVDPFFEAQSMPRYSEMALQLALSILLENDAWDRIIELSERIALWELSDKTRIEFDYTKALAYENRNQPENARPIWEKLTRDPAITKTELANAQYFLAIDDRRNENLKEAYVNAEDSLSAFMEIGGHEGKVKDLLSLLMEVAETSGRIVEALRWSEQYASLVDEDSVEWPALQYRIAQLHKKAADVEKWRTILERLEETQPDTLYGRMAARELKSFELQQDADQYQPPPL